jgi:hypothetical protein
MQSLMLSPHPEQPGAHQNKPLMLSLSKHEALTLRQAQDEARGVSRGSKHEAGPARCAVRTVLGGAAPATYV